MQKMAQDLDITAIDGSTKRRQMKRIQDSIDLKIAEDKGGEVGYHLSKQTGQSPITEYVVMRDGREIPYTLQQQRFFEAAFSRSMDPKASMPEVPYKQVFGAKQQSYAEDAAKEFLDKQKQPNIRSGGISL
jgi:hypothetical protein